MAKAPKVGATKSPKKTLEAPTPQTQGTKVSLSETDAQQLVLHRIWDHELREMTDVARPLCLAVATTAFGGTLGLIPSLLDAWDVFAAPTRETTTGAAIVLIAFVACVVLAITVGFFAVRGQLVLHKLRSDIRNKPYETRQMDIGAAGG